MELPDTQLSALGYKIFLDRYALKDTTRETLTVGDTVLVLIDEKTHQLDVGVVESINLPNVTVKLQDETVTRDIEAIDKPLETHPVQMMDRVAKAVAGVEESPEGQLGWEDNFNWLLEDWKFVPGGRILASAGSGVELTAYNCYVIPSPHDSREGIIATLGQMTEVMSRGGGVGINLSTLRPRYAYVKGVNGRSSGSVSWGELYSFVTGLIIGGGSRRGAIMLVLNDWHPDILEFVNSKRNMDRMTNANISVGISDEFMEAVKSDDMWALEFPDTDDPDYNEHWDGDLDKWVDSGHNVVIHETIEARTLWNAIIESAWECAEPGVWFRERTNKLSNSYYFSKLICTNPCGELPLSAWGACNLGSINLSQFYSYANADIDWKKLKIALQYAVRFLDNVIDMTPYFFEENERVQKNERRIGLGTMGLAELLIKLKIRYGSPESLQKIDSLYYFISTVVYEVSTELAIEKGSFPLFDADKFLQSGYVQKLPARVKDCIHAYGIRNVTLLTQAPTGSTGTMIGTSTGIEPYFSWKHFRKSRLGVHEEIAPIAQEWFDAHPGKTELPDYFVTAMGLSPEDHIQVQATIQRWVDSSISKTSNVPAEYTVEQTRELYELMYNLGCKGGTIYRDGSRPEQVLKIEEISVLDSSITVYPRPDIISGITASVKTPFGTAYTTMNTDDNGFPFEVFVTIGKAGSDLQANAEGLGRMISLQLRTSEPSNRLEMLKLIVEQLRGIGGPRSIGLGNGRISSLPDAVASALEKFYFTESDSDTPTVQYSGVDTCPSCGDVALLHTEGCKKCFSCGYSEC